MKILPAVGRGLFRLRRAVGAGLTGRSRVYGIWWSTKVIKPLLTLRSLHKAYRVMMQVRVYVYVYVYVYA
jgi:hypothetical protein